ncbi:MAG: DAK2 domain-containing protein [Lachnospiraceae bacterium]|nr:DAK2 domain-containing protein [Lachnospiraceae bacterium]
MSTHTIDAIMLRKMFLSGAKNLEIKKNWINELNVFPVPDGDTGTNMTLTIMSAATEVNKLPDATIDELAKAISAGSLRGARGNSGVILSQLLRGFTKVIRDHNEIDGETIALSFQKAVETAYKAVMKPKEGTILTVARAMADKAAQIEDKENLEVFLESIIREGDETLARTPEMLPVLKEAGVVDSGGQGLMTVLHGAVDAFNGLEIELDFEAPEVNIKNTAKPISTDEITFGYCTEFIVKLDKEFTEEDEDDMKSYLASLGDSLVFVAGDDIVKVHVHTNHPGKAFEKGLEYGQLTRMKVDNMREEHQERLFRSDEVQAARDKERREKEKLQTSKREEPRKQTAFISVTIGDGLSELFKQLGVDVLIQGGQTMNPSTDDMLNAIAEAHAENVFILPNNKNVILAANQAQELTTDCNVFVIPTKTIPQGITAVVSYVPDKSPEDNAADMTEEIESVKTGEVTYAVRDTKIDGVEIKSGDIMGIGDNGILAVGSDVSDVVMKMLEKITDEDSELISIYNGSDYSEEDAEALCERIQEAYPDVDVEVNDGGQPIYYVILSVE